jgi:uncharacterized membrane protein
VSRRESRPSRAEDTDIAPRDQVETVFPGKVLTRYRQYANTCWWNDSVVEDALMVDQQQAKEPTTVLAGPYGHPLHPALVAVPIGAWVSSVVLDVASRFVDDGATASHAAWWLLGIGVLGALAAATFGFLDFFGIPPGTRAWRTALIHMSCNLAATVLFAVAWWLRSDDVAPASGTPTGLLVLSLVALLLVSAGGFLGGELAYRFGVRVADEATQAAGYRHAGDHSTPASRRDAARRTTNQGS